MTDRDEIEASFYDQVYDRQDDVPFYLEYCSKTGGPILECCSGTGRIAIPIARAGLDITGLDLNEKMLRVCRSKLLKENQSVRKRLHLVKGDMRNFSIDKKFKIAFIAFASFLQNTSIEDEESTLRCIANHLEDNGLLILDIFNPDLSRPQHLLRLDHVHELKNRNTFLRFSSDSPNIEKQLIDSTAIYDLVRPNGSIKRSIVRIQRRYIFHDELLKLLERTGFQIDEVFGSFRKEKFTEKSPGIVCVSHKRK